VPGTEVDGVADAMIKAVSHYLYGQLVTDRAAFEILEWARDLGISLKVIVTCSEISEERKRIASELGSICQKKIPLGNFRSGFVVRPCFLVAYQKVVKMSTFVTDISSVYP
jgi:hypothetical protein